MKRPIEAKCVSLLPSAALLCPVGMVITFLSMLLCNAAHGASIFWTDETARTIERANADGSSRMTILSANVPPQGIAIDPVSGSIFWTDYQSRTIHRMNSDGTGLADLVTVPGEPRGIAVDPVGGNLYWALWGAGYPTIQRSALDGSSVQTLVISYYQPGQMLSSMGVSLDLPHQKVYWTEPIDGRIARCNFDGSNVENVLSGLTNPFMLDIDSMSGKIYWTTSVGTVQRANLDGSGVENIVTSGLVDARGIALDTSAGKIFIVDNGAKSILSANLDGSGLQTIASGLEFPTGIALTPIPEPAVLLIALPGCIITLALRRKMTRCF